MRGNGCAPMAAVLIVGLGLSGCAGDAEKHRQEPRPTSPPASTEAAEPDPGTQGIDLAAEEACMRGSWALDLADYAQQSTEWLLELGIPLDGPIAISGTYALGFGADGIFTIGENLVVEASVLGNPIAATNISAGAGEWAWTGPEDGESAFFVDDWSYSVPPGEVDPSDVRPPTLLDPLANTPIHAECTRDVLTLQGEGAPLVGSFWRAD